MALQPRVLMVGDHPDSADLFQLKLWLESYRVAVASNGVLGLELARDLKPDVILLDMHVPMLDGLQVLTASGKMKRLATGWWWSSARTTTRS